MMRNLPNKKMMLAATVALAVSTTLFSQTDRFAYAITDMQKDGASWTVLRSLDLQKGSFSDVLLDGAKTNPTVYDAVSRKLQTNLDAEPRFSTTTNAAFATGVAALSYDKKNNRLYYTPMFIDQLRYIDLKTNRLFFVNDKSFSSSGDLHNNEGKIMTRMVIAEDGNGYAISNDAQNFVRFSTDKKMEVTPLGGLVDDPSNTTVSIHNRCTSFGGDMIADNDGNLFIITNRNHIFKVNIETRIAKHVGSISGLPNEFTTNGAALTDKGDLLVSSAIYSKSYFTVDMKSYAATVYHVKDGAFRSSDLANGNVLHSKTENKNETTIIPTISSRSDFGTDKVQMYPNPVPQNKFTLQFSKMKTGDYTLELMDVMGRQVMQQKVSIMAEEQVEHVNVHPGIARGVYMIKMSDRSSKAVFSQKLVLQ
jgi:hypothetical protein